MREAKTIEWNTKLDGTAQDLLSKMDKEINSTRYRDTSVKDAADELTVSTIRGVAAELDQELVRLRTMQQRINQLQEKLKEVVGI